MSEYTKQRCEIHGLTGHEDGQCRECIAEQSAWSRRVLEEAYAELEDSGIVPDESCLIVYELGDWEAAVFMEAIAEDGELHLYVYGRREPVEQVAMFVPSMVGREADSHTVTGSWDRKKCNNIVIQID